MFRNFLTTFDLVDTACRLRDDGTAEPCARSGRAEPGVWTVAAHRADSGQRAGSC